MAALSIADVPANANVIVGVDTHKHTHLARAKDGLGRHLGQLEIATDPGGYAELLAWARGLGRARTFGIEGTSSYGAGLEPGISMPTVSRSSRSFDLLGRTAGFGASPIRSTPTPRLRRSSRARPTRYPRLAMPALRWSARSEPPRSARSRPELKP